MDLTRPDWTIPLCCGVGGIEHDTVFVGASAQGAFSLGSPRRQPQIPSTSECRFNKSPHHQNACSVLVSIKKNPGPGGALPPGGCSGAPPRRLPAFAPAIVVRACVRACVFLSVCLCVCVCNACVVRARVFERAWGVRVGAGRSVLVSVCPECRQAVAGRVALFRGRAKGVRHWWTCSRWVTERGGDKVRRRRGGKEEYYRTYYFILHHTQCHTQ